MKLKINLKKIISAFILIVVICSIYTGLSNSVYGKINENYSTGETTGAINVDQATEDSEVLDSVAHFIYAIAGFLEYIISVIMGSITGSEVFPWADRVIFNTMPFLDINFLSPSEGSLFFDGAKDTIFGTIVKNLYYTIFVLSVTFFSVVVGIMALKLAISSIAAEKAKYKQAITNWLLALILLFTVHYLISFIFFVNEKMVEVASSILNDKIEDVNFSIDTNTWTADECHAMVDLLLKSALEGNSIDMYHNEYYTKVRSYGHSDIETFISIEMYDDISEDYHHIHETSQDRWENYNQLTNEYQGIEILHQKWDRYICMLLTDRTYMQGKGLYDYETHNGWQNFLKTTGSWLAGLNESAYIAYSILYDAAYLVALEQSTNIALVNGRDVLTYNEVKTNLDKQAKERKYTSSGTGAANTFSTYTTYNDNTLTAVANIYQNKILNERIADENNDMLTNMSSFFKASVYTFKYDENGDIASSTASEFQPIPAILYAIFVIQSIMYFIAYIKRFFYIIVLALFAPLVIIYDFLTKTAMG